MTYQTMNDSPLMAEIYEPRELTGYDTFTEAKVYANPEHMKLQGEIHVQTIPLEDARKRLKKLTFTNAWELEQVKLGVVLRSPEMVNNTESWDMLENARKALYGTFLFATHPTITITAVTSEHMSLKNM